MLKKLSFIFLSLVLGSIFQLSAQETYIPLESDSVLAAGIINSSYNDYKRKTQLKSIKQNKELKDFFSIRHSAIQYSIEADQYLFDDYFYPNCKQILNNLTDVEPSYDYRVKDLLIGRSFVPNAYCYGNGILVINLGLISRFKNDDQMAFVIGHELAHQMLDHVDRKIEERIAYRNSKAFKKEIRKIKRDDYNKLSNYENLLLKQKLNSRLYSRERERQADSLAVVLMKEGGYDPQYAISALAILDKVDQPIYNDTIRFSEVFSKNGFEFNPKWLNQRDGLKVKQKMEKTLIDSLKTHPDCDERAKRLINLFDLRDSTPTEVDQKYDSIQYRALMENIQYELQNKRFGLALTESLQLINHFPDNRFLESTIGICLAEIYFAQKQHKLREFVPRPDDEYHYNYHLCLLFIENIRLSELNALSTSYMSYLNHKWEKEEIKSEQHLIYHQYLYNKITKNTAEKNYKDIYRENFPKGYFIHLIN